MGRAQGWSWRGNRDKCCEPQIVFQWDKSNWERCTQNLGQEPKRKTEKIHLSSVVLRPGQGDRVVPLHWVPRFIREVRFKLWHASELEGLVKTQIPGLSPQSFSLKTSVVGSASLIVFHAMLMLLVQDHTLGSTALEDCTAGQRACAVQRVAPTHQLWPTFQTSLWVFGALGFFFPHTLEPIRGYGLVSYLGFSFQRWTLSLLCAPSVVRGGPGVAVCLWCEQSLDLQACVPTPVHAGPLLLRSVQGWEEVRGAMDQNPEATFPLGSMSNTKVWESGEF